MIDLPKREEELLSFWEEHDIFKKSLSQREGKAPFIFYEGPPTANGKPGIHHVLTRSFKDVILRYKTMKGYYVPRKAGWDTHGLPVELETEKKLGISGKPQIEEYGVEKFNAACKESVWEYRKEWEALTKRIAFWVDLENPYVTYSTDYIETVWFILSKLHEKNLIYKGYRVVPHCPRCGTALSSHEVAQGYKTVRDTSVYVKFPLKDQQNTFVLSWTTTPWTLPGNVALAVNNDVDYVLIKHGKEQYYIAKALREKVFGEEGEIVKEVKGKDLVGFSYVPLVANAIVSDAKDAFTILPADFVTTTDGTGVVHTAVMYGEDDYNLSLVFDLPRVHTVDENGHFVDGLPWAGRFVKDKEVEKDIISFLDENGLLFKKELYEHEYPFCWRCHTPLLYYAKNSWFIKMSSLKQQLLDANATVNWLPAHIKDGRFGEWLSGIRDWSISRERYWGTPLPLWECVDCNDVVVIGSVEQLREHATNFAEVYGDKEVDLHKPFIDSIELKCAKCSGIMKRVREVLDCWFDSGAMPFAQTHWPFDEQQEKKQPDDFPADYICEAIDQTRGWFYTLLAVSTALGFEAPYKNVLCLSHILDAKGKKMSKSKGNVVNPWETMSVTGVDALRFFFYSVNQPGEYKLFDVKAVQEVVRNTLFVLLNVLSFYEMYAPKGEQTAKPATLSYLDKWILSRLDSCMRSVTEHLETFHIFEASRLIASFITELSTWYVRRSRDRFKQGGQDALTAIWTLREVLSKIALILAPFMPFIAEELYQRLGAKNESVHLEDWPTGDEVMRNEALEQQMDTVRHIVELGHALRSEHKLKVRQPLAQALCNQELPEELLEIIADELNVKTIAIAIQVEREGFVIKEDHGVTVGLDTRITPELKKEGFFRELVRNINAFRKEKHLSIHDEIVLSITSDNTEANAIVDEYKTQLALAVLAREVRTTKTEDMKPITVDGVSLFISFE